MPTFGRTWRRLPANQRHGVSLLIRRRAHDLTTSRRTSRCGAVRHCMAAIVTLLGSARLGRHRSAGRPTLMPLAPCPITDPTQPAAPRRSTDLQYAGAFRLPATEANGDSFSSGGGPMAYNPERNSLFVGTRSGRVAEVTIPDAGQSRRHRRRCQSPITCSRSPIRPRAASRKSPTTAPPWRACSSTAAGCYGTGVIYYDANNTQSRVALLAAA